MKLCLDDSCFKDRHRIQSALIVQEGIILGLGDTASRQALEGLTISVVRIESQVCFGATFNFSLFGKNSAFRIDSRFWGCSNPEKPSVDEVREAFSRDGQADPIPELYRFEESAKIIARATLERLEPKPLL